MIKIKKTILVILSIALITLLVACSSSPEKGPSYATITLRFSSAAFSKSNIKSYRIQYRAIPLFGNKDTVGRQTNWADIKETEEGSGIVNLPKVETGSWAIYARVSDASKTFIDIYTGPIAINNDYTIVINEEDGNLTGYDSQSIYIRADYVSDNQTLLIEYEDTKTGAVYQADQTDIEIVKNSRASIDYYLTSGMLPAGNYAVTVKILGDGGNVLMSKMQTVEMRSTGTDALIMRLSAEAAVPGNITIIGGKTLEGLITGTESALMGEECTYKFYALNEYTKENAVWYYWFADGVRYSTKETQITITFPYPGHYVVSCTAVGINGEVMNEGVCETKTQILLETGGN